MELSIFLSWQGNLVAQANGNCTGDPNCFYCNWDAVGVDFVGSARSVEFSGPGNSTGFDNITLGSSVPEVPIPAAVWLFGSGLLGMIAIARTKRVA